MSAPAATNHSIIDSDSGMHIHLELNGIFSYFLTCQLTLDEMEYWENYVMVGAATASKSQGVTPEHLSKVWRISHEDAARLIPPRN